LRLRLGQRRACRRHLLLRDLRLGPRLIGEGFRDNAGGKKRGVALGHRAREGVLGLRQPQVCLGPRRGRTGFVETEPRVDTLNSHQRLARLDELTDIDERLHDAT
jgi:hypothetical protein